MKNAWCKHYIYQLDKTKLCVDFMYMKGLYCYRSNTL